MIPTLQKHRFVSSILLILLILLLAVGINTLRMQSIQLQVAALKPEPLPSQLMAQRLAGAISFKTIAVNGHGNDAQFHQLHQYLEQSYPLLHAKLNLEKFGNSLLYTWQGSDVSMKPIALLAHQDVVPLAPNTEKDWQVDAFAGVIQDDFIWGRGSWDNKGNLLAQMEAVEMLLRQGFKPQQTVYLIAGADEEIGGTHGAKLIASALKSRGVQLEFVLDEGMLITDGVLKGFEQPVALVGIAEKGYASFSLSIKSEPGHSSMPPAQSNIGKLSLALSKLEAHPLPADIDDVASLMFETLAPEMPPLQRLLMSNLWLFKPLVQMQLEKNPATNAMIRSTAALTIFNAGERDNILPGKAEAIVNYRLLPGDSSAMVLQHIRQTVEDDAIRIKPLTDFSEASPISPLNNAGYRAITRSLRQLHANTLVAPSLMIAGTDARHFNSISDGVYRFSPIRATSEDLPRFHGTNERLSIENFTQAARFYKQLLLNLNAAHVAEAIPMLP